MIREGMMVEVVHGLRGVVGRLLRKDAGGRASCSPSI
jgi:hypothetical protein